MLQKGREIRESERVRGCEELACGRMESGSSSSGSVNSRRSIVSNQKMPVQAIRFQNPFTLKVGQVFTGFGVGCGVGIGVGRPLNLGAMPMLSQVMTATRGATDVFSGVGRHLNSSLRKLGAKNIEVGIGCGVGFGHGFGIGLAVKPGVLHQIQSFLVVTTKKMMMKFGIDPNIPFGQGAFPTSFQSGIDMSNAASNQMSTGSMNQLATKPDQALQGLLTSQQIGSPSENIALKSNAVDSTFGSRTEKVLSGFLENPLLKGEAGELDEVAGRMRSENNILRMVLKHQQIIEELVEENEKLSRILVEDLKIPSSKLQASSSVPPQGTRADLSWVTKLLENPKYIF